MKQNKICKGCGIEYNSDNVARIYGFDSSIYLQGYHSKICYTNRQPKVPAIDNGALIEICGSVVPISEVERVWKLHCDTPTPSANELESSEMERAIVDVPAEAADVYEYLDGEDGNFASEPAPEGWETGIAPTPGNERESGEGWTPGEWKIIDHLVYVGDIDKDFKNIALCGYDKKEESEANARLIAHSKKLYYALKEVSNYFEEQTPEVNEEGSSAYEFYRKIKSILNSINKQ